MPGVAPAGVNPTGVGGGPLEYKVEIDDASAASVGTAPDLTYIIPSMVATVSNLGHLLTIRPRSPGSLTFTVTATDKGLACMQETPPLLRLLRWKQKLLQFLQRLLLRLWRLTAIRRRAPAIAVTVMLWDIPVLWLKDDRSDEHKSCRRKGSGFPESSIPLCRIRIAFLHGDGRIQDDAGSDDNAITAPELDADGDAKTVDLEDVDAEKTGEPGCVQGCHGRGPDVYSIYVQSG